MPLNKAELIAFAQKHKDETNTEELVSNSLYDIEQHLRADLPVVLDMVLKRSIDKENQINLLLDLSNEFVISLVPFGCWEAPYGIYNRGPQNSRVPNSLIQARFEDILNELLKDLEPEIQVSIEKYQDKGIHEGLWIYKLKAQFQGQAL